MHNRLSEDQLAMPRNKRSSLALAAGYRLVDLAKKIVGRERLLRFFLNSTRANWRFAFELAGELDGADFHLHTKALNEDILRRHLEPGSSVIDIGCGTGRWCQIAAKYAAAVVGIDYNADLIEIARRETEAANVEYIVGDVTRDLGERRFDLAILTHVIEHIDEPDELLRHLTGMTRKLIVEVPDLTQDPLNLARLKYGTPFYSDADHVREYTSETLRAQMERTGWSVIDEHKNGGAVAMICEHATDAVE